MAKLSKLLCAYESELVFVCDRKRCTRTATHIVTWHVLDHCRVESSTRQGNSRQSVDLNNESLTGNRIFIMCAPCARDTVKRYREKVDRMRFALRQRDSKAKLECTSCGKIVVRLSDVCKMENGLVWKVVNR